MDQDYEGKILFNQVKIEDIKDYRQLVISFVYQNYQLIDYLSVKDNCLCYNCFGDKMNQFKYSLDNKRYHTYNYYLKNKYHQKN